MKVTDIPRELVYPIRQIAIVVPMIVTWLLFSIVAFFRLFGLLLFIATLIPFLGYLMKLLEARAYDRDAPAFDAELMAFVGNGRAILPLFIAVLFGWSLFALSQKFPIEMVLPIAVVFVVIFPASLAVLSITRSPLQALSPISIARFIQMTSADYLLLIITMAIVVASLYGLREFGTPEFLLRFGLIYALVLLYSLTGELVSSHRVQEEVDIPPPLAETPSQTEEKLIAERERTVSHAYGFASRGNRAGGLAHIQTHIDDESDRDGAYHWFFNKMLKWEDTDAALFFAQSWLHILLSQERDAEALKVMSQCFHANPRFRLATDDRDAAIELAERQGRTDLLSYLR